MSKVRIPKDLPTAIVRLAAIEGEVQVITDKLSGLMHLLTAKEWERAAIVRAFTTAQNVGGRGKKAAGIPAGFGQFAAQGIIGLRDRNTVARYHDAWEDHKPKLPTPEPGKMIEIPSDEFPKLKKRPGKTSDPYEVATSALLVVVRTAIDELGDRIEAGFLPREQRRNFSAILDRTDGAIEGFIGDLQGDREAIVKLRRGLMERVV